MNFCGSRRLFLYATLPDWFSNRDDQCLLRGTDCLAMWFRLTAQAIGRRTFTANSRVRSHHSPCEVYGGPSSTGSCSSASISVVPCQYRVPSAPYWHCQYHVPSAPYWHCQYRVPSARGEFRPRQTRQLPRAVDFKRRFLFLVVVKC
jgi:hypothetical protein